MLVNIIYLGGMWKYEEKKVIFKFSVKYLKTPNFCSVFRKMMYVNAVYDVAYI